MEINLRERKLPVKHGVFFLARFISGDPYGVLFIKADTAGVYTYREFIASLEDNKDTDLHLIQGFDYHF